MRRATHSVGSVIELSRARLGKRHELLHRAHRQRRMDNHQERGRRDKADRLEILDRVVGRVLLHVWPDRELGGVAEQQHVSVRRRFRYNFSRDRPARSGTVLDYHGLPQWRRDLLPY